MKDKLFDFITECYKLALESPSHTLVFRNQAYGALDFYMKCNGYDEDLAEWWNEKMLDEFNALMV